MKFLVGLMMKMFMECCFDLQLFFTEPKASAEAHSNLCIRAEAWLGFVRQLPAMRIKRQKIQAMRKRSDQEIALLMDRPGGHISHLLEQSRNFFQAVFKSLSG